MSDRIDHPASEAHAASLEGLVPGLSFELPRAARPPLPARAERACTLDERAVRQRFIEHARTYLFETPLREDPSWALMTLREAAPTRGKGLLNSRGGRR